MSLINKIPRALRVLVIIALLVVLVWRFGFNTKYFDYSVACAAFIAVGFIVAIYYPRGKSADKFEGPKKSQKSEHNRQLVRDTKTMPAGDMVAETIVDGEETDNALAAQKGKSDFKANLGTPKPSAEDVASRYRQMAAEIANREAAQNIWKPIPKTEPKLKAEPASRFTEMETESTEGSSGPTGEVQPPLPLIEDESSLTENDKNTLLNAVWYRCENPFCKITNFLTVHHIIDEKDGGTNSLDNLIVLCPYCHELAHKKEIPEKEMRDWISNRETRFKSQPDWPYD